METTILRSFLLLVLLPICHCGRDDDVIKGPPGVQTVYRDGRVTIGEENGFTLDLDSLNGALHKTFPYFEDGNEILFLVPQKGIAITKVVDGSIIIWIALPGESVEYAKLYLKNGQPALVFIVKSDSSGANTRWYYKDGEKWVPCSNNYVEKMDGLRVFTPHKADFVIHLDDKESSDQCTTFEANILGAPTRLYHPKPGYTAKEIVYGSTTIWRASGDQIATSCNLYERNGVPFIFLFVIRDGYKTKVMHMERLEDGTWVEISPEDFSKKLTEMRKVQPKGGYVTSDDEERQRPPTGPVAKAEPQKSWWSACLNTVSGGLSTATTAIFSVPAEFDNSYMGDEDEVKIEQPTQRVQWRRCTKEEPKDEPLSLRKRRNE